MPMHRPTSDGMEPRTRHGEADRKGRVTSLIALMLAIAIVAMSVGAVILPWAISASGEAVDYGKLLTSIAAGFGAILLSLVLMVPTVLIALRSASKPKGHVGRGRGLFSVIASVTLPVLCLGCLGTFAFLQAHAVMHSGIISKTVPDDDGNIRLVVPGNDITISKDVAYTLDSAGLLPETTLDEGGTIPVTAKNGTIYVGEQRLDTETLQDLAGMSGSSVEVTDEQLTDIAKSMESLEELGYSLGIDEDGQIVATDASGNSVTLSMDDHHNLSVDASTMIDLDAMSQVAERLGVSLDGLPFG